MKTVLFSLYFLLFILTPSAYSSDSETISLGGELNSGFQRLGSETIDLVETPFQIENNNFLITLGVAGAIGLTYIFDKDIQTKLQNTKSSRLDKTADAGSLVGDPFIHLGLAALVYGGGIAADSQKWKETGEMIGEALILSDASSFLIKEASGRGRPIVTSAKGNFKPFSFKNDYDSFPSMHTSSSFALASILAATSEHLSTKFLYYSTATFVGFSRMYQNKHWASDIILGAAIGELCGRVVINYHTSSSKISIVPKMLDDGAGLAVVGEW